VQPGVPEAAPWLDFRLYGLSEGWPQERWVELFEWHREGMSPPCADSVWLGHLGPQGGMVLVRTFPRDRHDQQQVGPGGDALREIAWAGAFAQVNLCVAGVDHAHGGGLGGRMVDCADRAADAYRRWEPVLWTLGDRRLDAWAWRFGGGWTAFTAEVEGAYLVVHGFGVEPDGVALAPVEDAAVYGLALDAGLASRGLTGGEGRLSTTPWVQAGRPPHPDVAALLESGVPG
jgi:hypothetical protein